MGKRICLTEQQRRDEADRQQRRKVAGGLARYKNEKGLTNQDISQELGISVPSVARVLKGENVCLPLSVAFRLMGWAER